MGLNPGTLLNPFLLYLVTPQPRLTIGYDTVIPIRTGVAFRHGSYIGNLVFLHICSGCFPIYFGVLYGKVKKKRRRNVRKSGVVSNDRRLFDEQKILLTPAIRDKNVRPKINVLNPWKLKKSKSRELFGIYQLISSANPAHI